MLSPSLRRLSVSSVVSSGFLCPSVVSPVSPAPSVVRVPRPFSPAGYGRPFIAFGGGLPSGVRGTRPSYVASVPSVPPPLRRLPSVPSSVPPFLLRSFVRRAPSSLRLSGRLSGLPLSLRRLSSLFVASGRPCPPRLFPLGVRPPFYRLRRRPALGGSGDTSFLRRLRSLRSSSVPPSALRSFLRSSVPSSARAATSGGGKPPPPPAGSGGGKPPPPPSLSPSLHSPAALPRPRSAVSCSGFAAALHFRGSLLSSGSACRPRWLQPPRPPPVPAPAGCCVRACVPRGT